MLPVEQSFKPFSGIDGRPLSNGAVYFGQPNQDPITHPVTVFWDAAGTQPALQPLRTVNGYIVNDSGSAANVFYDGPYSQLVQDSKGRQVFYAQNSNDFSISSVVQGLSKFMQSGVGAVPRTLQAKVGETVSLSDWATGDGQVDDSNQIIKAFAYAQSTGRRLVGNASANYRITKKIPIATAGNIYFDGCGCLFTNAISGDAASDPIFEISNQAVSNVSIGNFRVVGAGNNGHVVAVLGQLSTGPQFITLKDILAQGSAGNGKDHNGNAMPAQLLYAYGGMTIKIANCTSYRSGGIYAENVLKLHISETTIDSPPAGRLIYAKKCNNVVIDGACVMNGGTTDQIDVESCISVKVLGNRLKGSNGRQFYAHGQSSSIAFDHNQQEVYSLTTNAVEVTTAVQSFRAVGNSLSFINGSGAQAVFLKGGIAIVDEPGGGFISMCPVIEGNSFIVNSLMVIEYLIALMSTLNAVQRPRISSNVLAAAPGGAASTIKNGILLSGYSIGPKVEHNQYGATAGNTMTNGINVSANVTGALLLENYNAGNCTNPVADVGKATTRREGGVLVPVSWVPVLEGTTTTGAGNYSTQSASYTRDGNLVTFSVNLTWDSHTGTGSMWVPIPFTTTGKVQMLSVMADNVTFTGQLAAAVSANGQVIRLWAVSSNGALVQQYMDPNGSLFISGIVEVV